MKPTKVIQMLVEELKEAGVIRYNKEFLSFVGVETTPKQIKALSDYMRRDGEIRDRAFLKKIEAKLGLNKAIWHRSDTYQKQHIHKAVENALDLLNVSDENALDLSGIIRSNSTLSKIQNDLLEQFSNTLTTEKSEAMIDRFLQDGLLEKKIENQAFLVELLKLAYQKGLYGIIVAFILPNFYRRYLLLPEVQKTEAHTLGSLQKYDDAKHILEGLIHHNTIENINLRTSALSNHKRSILLSENSVDANALYTLIEGYQKLHAYEKTYSYYTGINLLYMVMLGEILFPADARFYTIDAKAIYEYSKPSLQTDKTHDAYYATMSEFEFRLLLGYKGTIEKIEYFLAHKAPHPSLVERTLRQMVLFHNKIAHTKHPLVSQFSDVMFLLQSYIDQFTTNPSR